MTKEVIEQRELLRSIEVVRSEETCFGPEVAPLARNQFAKGAAATSSCASLTNREREVLVLIADGLMNKEIASQLGVGIRTVETHRERIMRKLSIHSVAGLTKFALWQGLISLQQEQRSA